jgi:membrane-associated protease RseP (regulator of RpoE activity)
MNTTELILLILVIIYIPLWFIVWKHPAALRHGFEKYGPAIKINTRLGLAFIDRFGRYKRFWHWCGVFAQIVSFLLMVMMVFIMAVAVYRMPQTLTNGGLGLEYVLAIPGLNPLLPLWYGLLALIVALVCHELAHGLQSRANDIGVEHTGLLYAVVPLGAFVEPKQEDVEKAPRRAQIDLFTAGITTNFVIAAVSFLLFSGVMLGGISSPYGDNAAVYTEVADSPAYSAGIPAGALILDINGEPFSYTEDYTVTSYTWSPGELVSVHYRTADTESTVTMPWGLYVSKTVSGSPADTILDKKILSSITTASGTYKFYTQQAFSNFMGTTHPGDTVTLNYTDLAGSPLTSTEVKLGTSGSIGYLGVYTTTSGMNLITPNILKNTSANPFYGADSITDYATGMLSYIAHPFSGLDPIPDSVRWWYGDQMFGFWEICKIFYWLFWLNLMLGVTNALPAYPFDGGYVFRGWVDALYEKLGHRDKEERERRADEITRNVSTLMIFLYVLLIVAILI